HSRRRESPPAPARPAGLGVQRRGHRGCSAGGPYRGGRGGMSGPRTLFEKIWSDHVVAPEPEDGPAVLYSDLRLVHEVTSPQAFDMLRQRGLGVRRPERTLATMDHSTPTLARRPGSLPVIAPDAARQLDQLRANCREHGIRLLDMSSP